MTYQAGQIKRRRRTKDQMQQLDQQIITVPAEDNPQSVRHVFYRMTDPRPPQPVEKSDRGYNQVQNRMKLSQACQPDPLWLDRRQHMDGLAHEHLLVASRIHPLPCPCIPC